MFSCEVCEERDEDEDFIRRHEQVCREMKEREKARYLKRVDFGQLTIGQIIRKCESLPDLPVVVHAPIAWTEYVGKSPGDVDSYRGYYDELAIKTESVPMYLSEFSLKMKKSLKDIYYGYKGGEYGMNENTFVWVANYGEATGLAVVDLELDQQSQTINLVAREFHF